MLWIVLALVSAFFTAVATIFLKISLRSADPFFVAGVQTTVATLFIITAYVSVRGLPSFRFDMSGLYPIIVSGIASGLSWIFFVFGLRYGSATQVAVLERVNIVFIVVMCMTILGECWSVRYLIGALLVAIGAGLTTF